MSKIVVVGSSMIDFTAYSQRLPKSGETIIGSKFEQGFGGKGANQCVTAARLEAATAFVTALGSDELGQQYIDKLKFEGIDVTYAKRKKSTNTGAAQITVAENGDNNIIIVPGANELLTTEDIDEAAVVIKHSSVLVCQFETPIITTLHALRLKTNNCLSIVNAAPAVANIPPEIFKLADVFCINESEAESITGIENLTLQNVEKAVDKLLQMGCNTIIITLGSYGAVFASKENKKVKYIPADKVKPVDTTGAGDAFLGAFAYFTAYHANLSMEEIIKRSCKIATQSVLKAGTQMSFPRKKDLPANLFL
ncbi:ribokinase-like isoform X1 [Leptopilina heterotoma]|uniref:ribokinase-like isoform X1 n=1 Tax=Leptopilina heterotoma TaxID=63436 RepID=UPI001CA8DBBF|nr:ribokinase-like isoform X1 [Leptopilina heterotoma]